MNGLVKIEINESQEPVVSARELHKVLEVKKQFTDWWKQQQGYGFEENQDFVVYTSRCMANQHGGKKEIKDYAMKLDMAKELAMVSKTDKGKEVRKYFIQVEKDFNSPEKIMARALVIANKQISTLQLKLEEQQPMVEFAETVANTKDYIDMNEMAKVCNDEKLLINGKLIGRNKLYNWLRDRGYIMQNSTQPYQKYINNGLFKVVEVVKNTAYGSKTNTKTLISGKGQIKIVEMIRDENR